MSNRTPTDPEGLDPEEGDSESPTDPGAGGISDSAEKSPAHSGQHYQLTHDYLVPSLRRWLTRKQRESARGRAELRLAERTAIWAVHRQSRHLPALWEWANILLLTRTRDRTEPQRRMLRAASRQHFFKLALTSVLLAVLGVGAREWRKSVQAESKVSELKAAAIEDVPHIITELAPYRRWAGPPLRQMVEGTPVGSEQRLKQSLALLPEDPGQVDYLYQRLFEAAPGELHAIVDAIARETSMESELSERLWGELETRLTEPKHRLRAAAALAQWDGANKEKWDTLYDEVADNLALQDPLSLHEWWKNLSFVRVGLQDSLTQFSIDPTRSEAERSRVVRVLAGAGYAAARLFGDNLELFLEVDDRQYDLLLPHFLAEPTLGNLLNRILDKKPRPDEDEDRHAKRQAIAAVLLLQLDQYKRRISPDKLACGHRLWPMFRGDPDAGLHTYLVHRLGRVGVDPRTLIQQLDVEQDLTARRLLLLSLGEFSGAKLPEIARAELVKKLLPIYRDEPDPGIHSAIERLFRSWGLGKELEEIDRERVGLSADRDWYVSRSGHHFAVISRAPVEFQMGSPARGLDLQADHGLHTQRIPRAFALATKEITVKQFSEFLRAVRDEDTPTSKHNPHQSGPVLGVTWFQAAQYCRWLSEREGIPDDQMCYPPIAEIKPGMQLPADYLARTAYRLPTEAEWEYACRAGTNTSRHCGSADDMLGHYAWYAGNSHNRAWPVGGRMPNGYGLFDMYGNAWEWCQDADQLEVKSESATEIGVAPNRVVRGGAFLSRAANVRSAYRASYKPNFAAHTDSGRIAVGLRVARTLPAMGE